MLNVVARSRLRLLRRLAAGILAFSAAAGGWNAVSNAEDDIERHFKYGSIGAEERSGIPYYIWIVLPRVFPEHLPDRPGTGYERLGFIYEDAGAKRPIGQSYKEDRVALVGLNCATCHTGTYREAPGAPRKIVPGMPAHQLDLQGYLRFLTACARDSRFNAPTLLAAIGKENPDLSFFDRLIIRFFVVPRAKRGILDRARENEWMDRRPPHGPGRVDTFNPYKVLLKIDTTGDNSVGTADLPSLWNQPLRQGMWLHWDGNNDLVEERNKSAAIGAGASEGSLDLASMRRVEDWILGLKPPAFPGARLDSALAAKGQPVYKANCAGCHELGSPGVGKVTPLDSVGTDPERLKSFTPELARRMNTIGTGRPWRFSHFRHSDGYANMPLDGIWLRAPYLHNGSVPTLRALLSPPDQRPVVFHRGYDVYDWQNAGFVSGGAEAEKAGFMYDTRLPGNGNGGHLYGTNLPLADKEALLEYLKTL
jgi:mono/diheme cytochrome c family protein